MKPYILIAEDEDAISTMIQYNLESEGYEVKIVEDGEDALFSIKERKPDVAILDWMIPTLSGIEICNTVRADKKLQDLPIIILTARGEESDRLKGFDSGADDYIVKPFSPKELIARIQAIIRRTRPLMATKMLEYDGITIDIGSHKVVYNGTSIHLGPTEFRLLTHLIENAGQVYSREQLLDKVWGYDVYVESRTVDVHIRRLRKALSDVSAGLDSIIQTVRSAGYMVERLDERL